MGCPQLNDVYYGHRYYDADTGRWLNRDPVMERSNIGMYSFVHNDAINYWDVLGLYGEKPPITYTFTQEELDGELNVEWSNEKQEAWHKKQDEIFHQKVAIEKALWSKCLYLEFATIDVDTGIFESSKTYTYYYNNDTIPKCDGLFVKLSCSEKPECSKIKKRVDNLEGTLKNSISLTRLTIGARATIKTLNPLNQPYTYKHNDLNLSAPPGTLAFQTHRIEWTSLVDSDYKITDSKVDVKLIFEGASIKTYSFKVGK